MEVTKRDLQTMMDDTRVRARNEVQLLLNQVRDKVMFHIDNGRQSDRQLLKQAIAVAEQAVQHVGEVEARTSSLEQEVKTLQESLYKSMEQQNVSVPASAFAAGAPSEPAREQWRYSAA